VTQFRLLSQNLPGGIFSQTFWPSSPRHACNQSSERHCTYVCSLKTFRNMKAEKASGIVVPEETAVDRSSWQSRRTQKIEEPLEAVFSLWSVRRLYQGSLQTKDASSRQRCCCIRTMIARVQSGKKPLVMSLKGLGAKTKLRNLRRWKPSPGDYR
jgi:hypothetical protein